jgi:alkylation response protein AidB-like acyl-CoA dehydrogenase
MSPETEQARIQDAIAALLPRVREAREEAEALRQTPPWLAAELTRAGAYQLYLPRAMGGPELSPLAAFQIVEDISAADGSVGWCVMIAAAMSLNLALLPTEAGRDIAGAPADYRGAGSARPGGKAWAVEGGYRVTGRWNFASGMTHARWFYGTCVMMEGERPVLNAQGRPVLRAVWMPSEQVTKLDTWRVVGMRGTGSGDFAVEDFFVPEQRSVLSDSRPSQTTPLFHPRSRFVVLWTPSAANALGIARGAIDDLIDMAQTEASTLSAERLRDRAAVQAKIGEAEAIYGAARAYVLESVAAVWAALTEGREPADREIARARLAITHAMREATRAVDIVFHAAGTNAIYDAQPLERAFRDVHVAIQHGATLPIYYESAGKVMLGLRPEDPGW